MQTSYFSRHKTEHFDNPVSIALLSPPGVNQYEKLAPSKQLLVAWKIHKISEAEYIRRYAEETLFKLDPAIVYRELGEDAVLLCWEGAGKFCHRRLVAEWFETNLGVSVPEFGRAKERSLSCYWD